MVGSLKKDFYPFKKGQKKEFTISHFLKTKAQSEEEASRLVDQSFDGDMTFELLLLIQNAKQQLLHEQLGNTELYTIQSSDVWRG